MKGCRDLSAGTLNQWISQGRERDFLVVDIRKKSSYEREHIPGAIHIPAMDVEDHPLILKSQRNIVFYCRNGKRSKAALIFAADAGVPQDRLFHLKGGIMAYEGEILDAGPRLDALPLEDPLDRVLTAAMNFERAAHIFYGKLLKQYAHTRLEPVIRKLAQAEVSHGRMIYKCLDSLVGVQEEFTLYFQNLPGDVLEGGESIDKVDEFLTQTKSNKYFDVFDFALEMEISAYDLYRVMAEKSEEPSVKKMFFDLAQAEKEHVRLLISAQAGRS